jgi:outer membrane protein assembly factor BamB
MKTLRLWTLWAALLAPEFDALGQANVAPLWDFQAAPRVVHDPLTGQTTLLPAYIFDAPAVGADGTIYFGCANGKLYALTPRGTEKWSFTTGAEIQSSPAVDTRGTIYFGSVDRKFYALNPDGTKRWEFPTGDDILSSPALALDGSSYFGSRDGSVYALKPDGTLKWRFPTGRQVISSPVIGRDGTVYIGSTDWNLYSLRPDGTERWHLTYGAGPAGSLGAGVALAEDGTIYAAVAGFENRLYALDSEGHVRWEYPFGPPTALVAPTAPVIGPDGTLYLGTPDRTFYAIRPDGTKRWDLPTGTAGHSTASLGEDGTLYFSTWDKEVFAVGTDGEIRWRYVAPGDAAGGFFASVPTLTAERTLYVGSGNGHLYAFAVSSGFASAAWPMFGRSPRHTSNLGSSLVSRPTLNALRQSGGSLALQLWAEHGVSLRLEGSANLGEWAELARFTATGSTIEWSDPSPPALARFYRLVQP